MSINSHTVAIVTGGSRGIGLSIAASLLARGARVGITGTDSGRLAKARLLLSEGGAADRVMALQADVRVEADVQKAVAQVVHQWGGLDILVNNAGVGARGEVADLTSTDWRRVIDTNLTGVFHCCHAAIGPLKSRGGGWIINVSSLASENPFPGGAAYCASKAGLNAFSDALMQELRHEGIRVSVVLPGSVRTGFGGANEGPGSDWKLAADDVAQVIVDLVAHPGRSLPSRVEIRPSRPPRK